MTKLANFDQLGSYRPLGHPFRHPPRCFHPYRLSLSLSLPLSPAPCVSLTLGSWPGQLAACLMRAAFTLTDRRSFLISRYIAQCGLAAD